MRIITYLPSWYADVMEMRRLTEAADGEFAALAALLPWLVDEATINGCSEARLVQWEALLALLAKGSLSQRRALVLATLKGYGKLTEARIKTLVSGLTGASRVEVDFHNSRLAVRIYPPNNGEVFLFPAVEQALRPLIPAHIDLGVERWYCTWGDVKQRQSSWQTVNDNFATWNELKMWNLEV